MIGKALAIQLVRRGYDVIILTRNKGKAKTGANLTYAEWDINKGTLDSEAITRADYIVHLAGANVAEKRWTKHQQRPIR